MELYGPVGEQGAPEVCGQDYGVELEECDVIVLPLGGPSAVEPVVVEYRTVADAARGICV